VITPDHKPKTAAPAPEGADHLRVSAASGRSGQVGPAGLLSFFERTFI